MRLNKLHIKGFKDPERIVDVVFSKTPISVVYGENGSGKTTLLKIIHAILDKNEDILRNENVQEVDVEFETVSKIINTKIKIEENNIDWGEDLELNRTSSILFGVNRGVIGYFSEKDFYEPKRKSELEDWHMRNYFNSIFDENVLEVGKSMNFWLPHDPSVFSSKNKGNDLPTSPALKKHAIADFVPVSKIEELIIKQHEKGQDAVSEKVKNAFFNTIASAVEIEVEKTEYHLPDRFWERFNEKRSFLLNVVKGLDESTLQGRLLGLLENENSFEKDIPDSKIFKALLVNVLEKAEEKNDDLKSINKFIEIFNNHLYGEKELVVNSINTYIKLPRKRMHYLRDLSSGERHLLTFLTLFLIVGRGQDFYLIDEPEISLSMKWQRDILPLLSELSPESQIIVATHSPSIANRNTEYLVKLV